MISNEEFKDLIETFVEASNAIKDGWFLDIVRNQTFVRKKHVLAPLQESCASSGNNPNPNPPCMEPVWAAGSGQRSKADPPSQSAGMEEEDFCEVPRRLLPTDKAPKHENGRFGSMNVLSVIGPSPGALFQDDQACMPTNISPTLAPSTIHYEYHILYSESYSVPVLYLNVLNSSGQRLSLDEVWGLCPDAFQPHLQQHKWTTLTQQEHPLLGIPFLMLHPCHTADLMTQLQVDKEPESEIRVKRNYLVSWLSTVGPLVGLRLSEQYALSSNLTKGNN